MIGEIIKIIPMKNARYSYKRLILKLNDGSYAKTDIVVRDKATGKPFRNFARWRPFLKVGKKLGGLKMMAPDKIDADSDPYDYDVWNVGKSLDLIKQGRI